jgi:hypothetical protein
MDPRSIATGLAAFPGRAPGSDAERRAAGWLAGRLRGGGREVSVRTLWVRPQWPVSLALHAAAGVAASILVTSAPVVGGAILLAILVSAWLEVSGRTFVVRAMLPRRATQNVIATQDPPPPDVATARLVLTAHYDAPRTGLAYRDGVRRAAARALGGRAPGLAGLLLGALTVLIAVAALRLGDVDAPAVRGVQLAATVVLLLALALLVDTALSPVSPGANDNASGTAVAAAVADALHRAPPRNLAVEVVLAGAGEGTALGFGAYVGELRRTVAREDAVVLEVLPCGRGSPRFWTHDGVGPPLRLHPRLVALAREVARDEAHLGAAPHRGHGSSGAYAARVAGYPALAVGCLDDDALAPGARQATDTVERLDPAALRAALELCLALVARIDGEVGARRRASGARGPEGVRQSVLRRGGRTRRASRGWRASRGSPPPRPQPP